MAQDQNFEQEDDIMRKIEEAEKNSILLEKAFNNAYLVLTEAVTFETLLRNSYRNGDNAIMAFDPERGPKKYELENMIIHFTEQEEYEKCAVIRDMLKDLYPNENYIDGN
jgi:hypothetical protein|tara:strand:- start:2446 stop:2775 length:330 start_codon:yes stop_codon:yes gene_type:complete